MESKPRVKSSDMKSTKKTTVMCQPPGIVIGVDFGTTYSGIAWALTAAPDDIFVIKSWPTKNNSSYEKVPSQISYQGVSQVDGEEVPFDWGFKAQKHKEKLQWIKLLLDPSQNRRIEGMESSVESGTAAMPDGKTAFEVVTDFFKGLRNHFNHEISNKLGEEFLQVTPKQFVFTVPAMWSDKAKNLTERAARAAGFTSDYDRLRLVPEPEAAALCCLRTIQPSIINVGDNFVVVDCGGGTVDLISYQILSLNPLEVRESAVGEGDLCGSVFINKLFEDLVRDRMGSKSYDNLKPAAKEVMMRTFDEDIKRSFSNDEDEEVFTIPVPGIKNNPKAGIEGGFFVLDREEMVEIFDPIVQNIQSLVERQCAAIRKSGGHVKALFLVGGFGSSPHLEKHFKHWGAKNGNIKVLQPPDAWSCIVRGAVINGLEGENNMVRTRLTRRYYGTTFSEPFIDNVHPEKYRFWNERKNAWYCSNRMHWFINKGDKIQDNQPFEKLLQEVLYAEELLNPVTYANLYAYEGDAPPRYQDVEGVYKVTELKANLSAIPLDKWTKRNYGSSRDVMELSVAFRVIVHGALLKFQLCHDGKQYGSVSTKFDWE